MLRGAWTRSGVALVVGLLVGTLLGSGRIGVPGDKQTSSSRSSLLNVLAGDENSIDAARFASANSREQVLLQQLEALRQQLDAHDQQHNQALFQMPSDIADGPEEYAPTLSITDVDDFIKATPDDNASPVRICLVTSAVAGPTLNGGIATAFHAMARHLAEAQHDGIHDFQVTVLYAAHPFYMAENSAHWVAYFRSLRIAFVPLKASKSSLYGPKLLTRSYRIFEYLREREGDFDVISYHDYMGNGYFTALAKRQGLAFANTYLFVQCHSTIRWADDLNHRPPKDHNTLAYYFMEKKALEWADARVSPSRYYLEWMDTDGHYNLTAGRSFVVQNLMYPLPNDNQRITTTVSRHFVFFARLEVRKGLLTFLDALDHLGHDDSAAGAGASNGPSHPDLVTFLGPDVSIDGQHATELIRQRFSAGHWARRLMIETKFDTTKAIDYIRKTKGIVVMPTLGDNSPYVVLELLANELPMITTDAGGGKELLSDAPDAVVRAGDPVALANAMRRAMTHGIQNAHVSSAFSQSRATYFALIHSFRSLARKRKRPTLPGSGWRVTIGVTSYNRPRSLLKTVKTIAKQSYPSSLLRVVIIDDASDAQGMDAAFREAKAMLDAAGVEHDIVQNKVHQYVAQSRNEIFKLGVDHGSNYVCLMDDDDIALPHMLAVYMRVATMTKADVLTDFSDNYDIVDGRVQLSHRSIAVGNAFAHNFFINNYGKANFCARPDKALAIGGHNVGRRSDSPYVDWGFFTRASLHNLKVEVVPLALYKYTKNSDGSIFYGRTSQVDRFNGHAKMIDDISRYFPSKFRDILMYCRYRLGIPKVTADGPL
eukprot:m.40899 g.40899  ORF g.40899 m.40899 type:complete len:825 (-) comp11416_c0_seq1:241-2715(-)